MNEAFNERAQLPLPSYFDPEDCHRLFVENRGDRVGQAAGAARRDHDVRDASEDTFRIGALGIDCQVAFCHPEASLFVSGAVEDTERTVAWIYRNAHRITKLVFSLDTHSVHQVFHAPFWVNSTGAHPAPFQTITADDVRTGRWMPLDGRRDRAREYCERLEASGRYVLTIWPLHALLGGTSHALIPALAEAALYHAIARRTAPHFELKGTERDTESYSVLLPEVTELRNERGEPEPIGVFRRALFEELMSFDRLYVFGQASSHCVLATLRDIVDACRREGREELLRRIHILSDTMSPVAPPPLDPLPPELDFPRVAARALDDFHAAGMNVGHSTEPLLVGSA